MIDLFIDSRTGAYPRHPGDVELEPGDFWIPVQRKEPNEPAPNGYIYIENPPVQIDDFYVQDWRLEVKPEIPKETLPLGLRMKQR